MYKITIWKKKYYSIETTDFITKLKQVQSTEEAKFTFLNPFLSLVNAHEFRFSYLHIISFLGNTHKTVIKIYVIIIHSVKWKYWSKGGWESSMT